MFTVPTSTVFLANAATWVTGLQTDALLVAAVLVGISVIFLLASGIMGKVISGVGRLTGRGRSGGRRGRRR